MPTIDELIKQLDKERLDAEHHHVLADQIADNPDLKKLLYDMAKHEEEHAVSLENKISHLLEIEQW